MLTVLGVLVAVAVAQRYVAEQIGVVQPSIDLYDEEANDHGAYNGYRSVNPEPFPRHSANCTSQWPARWKNKNPPIPRISISKGIT